MSCTKTTDAEVYAVRKDYEWATIMLRCWSRPANVGTPHERPYYCGEILIHSSYGSWGNTWTACGEPFKEFLLDAEFDYVFTKFMGTRLNVWDGEGSVESLRERLLEWRKTGELTKGEARALWDEIDINETELETSERDFVECAYRMAADIEGRNVRHFLAEPWELTRDQHDSQAVGFWRELWPEFIATLQAEVAAAKFPCAA